MFMAPMVDMANTAEDIKDDMPACAPTPMKGPRYPYGLCIRFDNAVLKKLKLDGEMPEVGEMIHLFALAKVTSVSQNETEDTNGGMSANRCVELQITHLATESEDQENAAMDDAVERDSARRKRFYPDMVQDNDNDAE